MPWVSGNPKSCGPKDRETPGQSIITNSTCGIERSWASPMDPVSSLCSDFKGTPWGGRALFKTGERMSRFIVVMACLSCLLPPAAEAAQVDCFEKAETQAQLNACAGDEYASADAELNRVYKEILAKYKDDPKFIAKLRAAQRAWLTYRDAELDAKFPHADEKSAYYGSIFSMCDAQYKAGLTRERVAKLREWLDGVEEGDACSGSVKIKQ